MRAKRMTAERFCEECQAVCDDIQETGRPYIITKNGKGLVKLLPPDGWEPAKKSQPATKKSNPNRPGRSRKGT